jgi:hypothetical protein
MLVDDNRIFLSSAARLLQVEGAVGRSVVVVFRTKGTGNTRIAFGLTRGERPKAVQAVTYRLTVTGR